MNFNHDTGLIDTLQILDVSATPPAGGIAGVLTIEGSGGLILPSGNTSERPSSATPGTIRYNTDLSIVEVFVGGSWVSESGGTVTSVAVTGSTGLTVGGSPITTSGTITLTLNAELQGLSQLSANGIVARTGIGTYTPVAITGTAGDISVTNGDGVAGNPTIDLVSVGTPVTNLFQKITTDAKGRVTATSNVTSADITTSLGYTPLNKAGDTVTGNLTFTGGATITGVPTPTNSSDVAPKSYVDALQAGLEWKAAVAAATTANLTATYVNGTSGVGATLTNAGAQTALVVDGYAAQSGDRILVKNQTAPSQNGIYIVTTVGSGSTNWVLTRTTDANTPSDLDNASMFVTNGTVNAASGWTQTVANPIIGTNSITFVQFDGTGTYVAGTGLTLTGNVFSITSPVTTSLGGTGLTSIGSANQILAVNTSATGLEYKTVAAGTGISITPAAGAITINNTGVTSVALSAPSIFAVSGSPVTTAGTLSFTLNSQSPNTVFAGPGSGGSATPTFRSLVYADISSSALKLYAENASSPTNASATGTNAVAIGNTSLAAATNSLAIGQGSNARLYGMMATANGSFATAGDAQQGTYILRAITSNATAGVELFLDGVSQRLVMPNNSVWTFDVVASARRTDTTGGAAGYQLSGVIRKDATAASTVLVGTVSKVVLGETNAAWDMSVTADTTNGSLKVAVTGEASKTIRWVAAVIITEVTN